MGLFFDKKFHKIIRPTYCKNVKSSLKSSLMYLANKFLIKETLRQKPRDGQGLQAF